VFSLVTISRLPWLLVLMLLLDLMPLPSHSKNSGKGWAKSLYNLAYQRPQPLQKGHNTISIE
jgi:hypothetical protein